MSNDDSQLIANQEPPKPEQSVATRGLGPVPPSGTPILTPTPASDLTQAHTDFVTFHEGYIRHYISLADSKATIIFGVSAGLLAYLFSQVGFHSLIANPSWTIQYVQAVTATLFLVLSAGCSVFVITPRLKSSGVGIVFFGSVAKYPSGMDFMEQLARRNESELTAARIQHTYDVSKVCVRKYDMLRRAIWFGCLGAVSCLPILSFQ